VRRTRELWRGEREGDLPDLLVEWSDDAPTGSTALAGGRAASVRANSPKLGVLEAANAYGRTGEHRPEGFFVARGAGLRPGRLARAGLEHGLRADLLRAPRRADDGRRRARDPGARRGGS